MACDFGGGEKKTFTSTTSRAVPSAPITMPSTIPLLDHEPLTFQQALSEDFNVIQRHHQVAQVQQQFSLLWSQKDIIAAIVKAQLGLQDDAECAASAPQEWIRGKFNICIPIHVESCQFSGKVMMRCPMPSSLSDSYHSGRITERLRSEIGAHAWLQQNCPDIRIPQLYGFSILDHHVCIVSPRICSRRRERKKERRKEKNNTDWL